MTPQEAFDVLGLKPDVTEEEVREAYRERSFASHPDVSGQSDELQKRINEAREVLDAIVVGRSSLVALQHGAPILRVEKALTAEKAARQATETTQRAKRRKTWPLQFAKYAALIAGAIAATGGWFGEHFLPMFQSTANPEIAAQWKTFALVFGAVAGALQLYVSIVEQRIQTFLEDCGDRKTCATKLASVLRFSDKSPVTEDDFSRERQMPDPVEILQRIIPVPGSELHKVLILKAVEHGLLMPTVEGVLGPDTVLTYEVAFRPSSFKPKPIDPPKPPTVSGAKGCATGALVAFAILGSLTAFLAMIPSGWAVLPGFLALSAGLMVIESVKDYRAAKRREASAHQVEDAEKQG